MLSVKVLVGTEREMFSIKDLNTYSFITTFIWEQIQKQSQYKVFHILAVVADRKTFVSDVSFLSLKSRSAFGPMDCCLKK